MSVNVHGLIATLTKEREALDATINSLRRIWNVAQPEPTTPRRRTRRAKSLIAVETKAAIVRAMRDRTGPAFASAKALGTQYGINTMTIYTGWQGWERGLNGSTAPQSEVVQ